MRNPARSPLDFLWTPPALVAAVLAGEALALVVALSGDGDGDRWVRFGLASLLAQWTALAGLGAIYLMRGVLARLGALALAWSCLALLLVSATVVALAARAVMIAMTGAPVAPGFMPRVLGIALVVGLLGLVVFQNWYVSRRAALRAKQAELEALHARIHPHFLFNTLNSAAALVHGRPDDAERVLLDMSDLFRAALSAPGWVPLEHELDLCRRYLAIEQQRFGDRLRSEWAVSPGLEAHRVPLLSIQPLVENAVAHGLDRSGGGKSVHVGVRVTATALVVEVRNPFDVDGPSAAHAGHRIGLAGVRARIESATGGSGALETSADDGRFVARVVLPLDAIPSEPQTTTS